MERKFNKKCLANLIPGDKTLCTKAGKARAAKRNIDGMNLDMTFRPGTISTNTSTVQGVSWAKNMGKWHVYVGYKSYRCNLGYYNTLKDAKRIRELAELSIKDNTFEDFFYEVRGFRIEERLQKQFKVKEN